MELLMVTQRRVQKPTLKISPELKRQLDSIGLKTDTYEDIIQRLLDEHNSRLTIR